MNFKNWFKSAPKPMPYAQIFTAMDAFDGDKVGLIKTLVKTYAPAYHIKKRPSRKEAVKPCDPQQK